MRLICIPLFLAVAIRPVDAGAHAKPSDIVTTTGQLEVQGNLRVQEPAHDKSHEERMISGLEDLLLNALEEGAEFLKSSEVNPRNHKGASDMTNMNLNTRKRAMEPLSYPEQ